MYDKPDRTHGMMKVLDGKRRQRSSASELNDLLVGVTRAMELREELFDIANSYAGNETGNIAVMLHRACTCILNANNSVRDN